MTLVGDRVVEVRAGEDLTVLVRVRQGKPKMLAEGSGWGLKDVTPRRRKAAEDESEILGDGRGEEVTAKASIHSPL